MQESAIFQFWLYYLPPPIDEEERKALSGFQAGALYITPLPIEQQTPHNYQYRC